jgi:hypothetical protein
MRHLWKGATLEQSAQSQGRQTYVREEVITMRSGERRREDRVVAKRRLAFCEAPMGKRTYAVKDLSSGGICLSRGPTIPVGTQVDVAILNGLEKPLRLAGRVVNKRWISFGVEFDTNDPAVLQKLDNMLEIERSRDT